MGTVNVGVYDLRATLKPGQLDSRVSALIASDGGVKGTWRSEGWELERDRLSGSKLLNRLSIKC